MPDMLQSQHHSGLQTYMLLVRRNRAIAFDCNLAVLATALQSAYDIQKQHYVSWQKAGLMHPPAWGNCNACAVPVYDIQNGHGCFYANSVEMRI